MSTHGGKSPNLVQLLSVALAEAATGNFTSDVLDKGSYNTCSIQIDVTAGATPTATFKIQGSLDGVNWFSIPYRTPSSDTPANTDITLTASGVSLYYLDPKYVRYVRVDVSANTNITVNEILAVAVF